MMHISLMCSLHFVVDDNIIFYAKIYGLALQMVTRSWMLHFQVLKISMVDVLFSRSSWLTPTVSLLVLLRCSYQLISNRMVLAAREVDWMFPVSWHNENKSFFNNRDN